MCIYISNLSIYLISIVFDTTYDDPLLEKSLEGFYLCAQISAQYSLTDVFDHLIVSLSSLPLYL